MGYHDLSGRPWEVMKDWHDALSGGAQLMKVLGAELPSDLSQLPSERCEIEDARGATNPSVCVHGGRLYVSLRHPDGIDVGALDGRRCVLPCRLAWSSSPRDMNPPRLFSTGAQLSMLAPWAASWDVPGIPAVRVAHCLLSEHGVSLTAFSVCKSERYEKNWMPVAYGGELRAVVYSVDPLVVLRERPFDARSVQVKDFSALRGSTQVIAYSTQDPMPLLGVCHQVHKLPAGGHAYLHRFCKFDLELTRAHVGRPFYLGKVGVEIAAGLCHWRSAEDERQGGDGRLLLSYGTDDMNSDRKAWVAEVTLDAMEETFR